MSALSDTITGLARDYPHLSELSITRIVRKAWPHVQRCEVVSTLQKHGVDRPATNGGDEYNRVNIQLDAGYGMTHDMIAAKYGQSVGDVRYDGRLPSTTPAPEEGEAMDPIATGQEPEAANKDDGDKTISVREIVTLRAQGRPWKEIAATIGVSYMTLQRVINAHNLPREPKDCRTWLDEHPEPASAGDLLRAAISKGLEQVTIRKRGERPSLADVAKLRASGRSWKRIAAALGCAVATVHKMGQECSISEPEQAGIWCDQHDVEWWVPGVVYPAASNPVRSVVDGEDTIHSTSTCQLPPTDTKATAIAPKALPEMTVEPLPEHEIIIPVRFVDGRPTVSPPLLTVSKHAWPGTTARRRLQTLIAALDDAEIYDVELCIREVQA